MSVSIMKKLTVISPFGEEDSLIRRLVRLRCVEVKSVYSDEYGYLLETYDCDEQKIFTEKKIAVIERIIPEMNKRTKRKGGLGDCRLRVNRDEFISSGRYDTVLEIAERADDAIKKISKCRDEIIAIDNEITSLKPLIKYDVSLDLQGSEKTDLTLGNLPAGTNLAKIEEAFGELYAGFEVIYEDASGVFISLITHKTHTEQALRTLNEMGFIRASYKGINVTPKEKIGALEGQKEALRGQIEVLDGELNGYAEYLSDIEVVWDIEKTNLVIVQGKQNIAKTQKCTVISAWIPEQCCQKVEESLQKVCCAYGLYEPLDGEEPPVQLVNNKYASNFEWVVGMYSYPKYGSFDPTFIMSIFYFFIFGLMFADVGYGLLMVLGGFLIPKIIHLSPSMKRSFNMFGYCGISGIAMGVLFGGWFGDLPYAIMENMMGISNAKEAVPFFNGICFNPIDDPMKFLVVSLAAGGVHLIAGMAVKFVLLCKEGKIWDAIFDIGAWWIIFAGIAVWALVGTVPGGIVCGIGVLIIICTHGRHEKNIVMKIGKGLLGLYDITSYASDLLSYSRILALGLAAAVIAQVINLIGTMGGSSVGGFIALIFAFIIGHGLNLAINILGSFVHTSRLQYLEFFNKFYEDGGVEFKSMEPSEKYSVE